MAICLATCTRESFPKSTKIFSQLTVIMELGSWLTGSFYRCGLHCLSPVRTMYPLRMLEEALK